MRKEVKLQTINQNIVSLHQLHELSEEEKMVLNLLVKVTGFTLTQSFTSMMDAEMLDFVIKTWYYDLKYNEKMELNYFKEEK